MLKFNRYCVTDGTIKARVFYDLDNHVSGRRCVTLYEKDYAGALSKLIPNATTNATEIQTDYVVSDVTRLFEDHPLYATARARAEAIRGTR